MKRRDFIKKGSAVVATTVIASCGGGETTTSPTTKDNTDAGNTNPGTTNPGTNPAPVNPVPPVTAPVPDLPAASPGATVAQTFYITDGIISLGDASDRPGSTSVNVENVYFRSFNIDDTPGKPMVPGKAMIVNEGDNVDITVINRLQTTHNFTISRVVVVGNNSTVVKLVESKQILPGEQRLVSFVASTPGTYIYEDATQINSMIGMHGGFVVMPLGVTGMPLDNQVFNGSRTFIKQQIWVFNDIDPRFNKAVETNTALPRKFVPRYFTMNGLSGRPPGSNGYGDPTQDSMHDPRSMLVGKLFDRTLMRCINVGMAKHSMHIHANHLEWLTQDGENVDGANASDKSATLKDVVPLNGKLTGQPGQAGQAGICDVIYPFDAPPDAWPVFNEATIVQAENAGRKIAYPMHLHDEMTQTANGGSYLFGTTTDIFYKSNSTKV